MSEVTIELKPTTITLELVGGRGKSAYESYLETTDDDPVLTEEEWSDRFSNSVRHDVQILTDNQKAQARTNIHAAFKYPRAISVTGSLVDGYEAPLVFPTLLYFGEINGKPAYTETGSDLGVEWVAWYSMNELKWLLMHLSGGMPLSVWTSTASVDSPDLVPSGDWNVDTNPDAWFPHSGSYGTPVVTSADIVTNNSLVAAGGALAAYALFHTAQTLTEPQQEQARANIGAGDNSVTSSTSSDGTCALDVESLKAVGQGYSVTVTSSGINSSEGNNGISILFPGALTDAFEIYIPAADGTLALVSQIPTTPSDIGAAPEMTSGDTPPANPVEGQEWFNTNVGTTYVYYQGAWVSGSPNISTLPHADTHAVGGSDPLTPAAIGAATSASPTITGTITIGSGTWNGSAFTGPQTFSGQVELSASQAATNPASAMTRELREIEEVMLPGGVRTLATATASTSGAGSFALGTGDDLYVICGTGATAWARLLLGRNIGGQAISAPYTSVDCSKNFDLAFSIVATPFDSYAVLRLLFGGGSTPVSADSNALAAKGWGIEIRRNGSNDAATIRLVAYDSGFVSGASTYSWSSCATVGGSFLLRKNGANLSLFKAASVPGRIDTGSAILNQAIAPTSGMTGQSNLVFDLANGASSTVGSNARFISCPILRVYT